MDKKDFVKISRMIFDAVLKFSDEEIQSLLDGQSKIILDDKSKIINKKEKVTDEGTIIEISEKLNSFESREEVMEYLIKGKFNIKILKEIAKNNNIYINSRCRKNEIIDEIVEGTIGAKLKFKVLKGEI